MLQFSKFFTGKPTLLSDLQSYHETFLVRCIHHKATRRFNAVEPKSDKERLRLGLPLREPWFEIKPFYEKRKYFVLRLKEILKSKPYQKIEVAKLGLLREELDAIRNGKQRKIATYVRKYPLAFLLKTRYTNDNRKKTWVSFTDEAKRLLEEEKQIMQESENFLVQKLCKILMMSMKNRLPLSSIDSVRESLGLPFDYREVLVKKYSDLFYVNERKGRLYLELSGWDESLAQSALERKAILGDDSSKSKTKKKREKPLIDAGQVRDEEQKEACDDAGCLSLEQDDGKQIIDEYSDVEDFASDEFQQETSFNSGSNKFQLQSSTSSVSSELRNESNCLKYEHVVEEAKRANNIWNVNVLENPHTGDHHEYLKMDGNAVTIHCHLSKTNLKAELYSIDRGLQDKLCVSNAANPESIQGTQCSSLGNLTIDKVHQEESISQSGVKCENSVNINVHTNLVPSAIQLLELNDPSLHEPMTSADVEKQSSVCSIDCNDLQHAQSEAAISSTINTVNTLRFPWKNKKGLQPRQTRATEIEEFQAEPYISPYKNSRDLELPSSLSAEKFAVAAIHEFLSLTLEKRTTIQQLEQFRKHYRLPEDLIEFLLRYDGVFYVVRGTPRSHVFLKEAYKESLLLEKEPLVLWQERFVELAFKTETSDASKSKKVTEPKEPILKGYYAYKDPKGYFGSEGCKIKV